MRPTMILKVLLLSLVVSFAAAKDATAGTIFNFAEVAGNVELTVSGSLDLNVTLSMEASGGNTFQGLQPLGGNILVGSGAYDYYNTTAWTPFGTGGVVGFSSSSGDRVALFNDPGIGLPAGYISGSPLFATGTILGATFASLGMTPGSHVTVLTNGRFTDTVTVNVGAAAVPEPATLLLFGTGLAAIAARRRMKRA